MADYNKFKVLAKRLIETNGRPITLLRSGNTPNNNLKPWRGSINQATNTAISSINTIGLFVHPFLDSDLLTFVATMAVPYNDTVDIANVLIHADLLDGVVESKIELYDYLKDNDTIYKIKKVKLLAPGDTRIAYALEVSQ